MTRQDAEGYTNYELAELLIEHVDGYQDSTPEKLAVALDRSDALKDLQWADVFDDEE